MRLQAMAISSLALLLAHPASAENTGQEDKALLLGPVPTFATAEQAHRACGKDQVVWADRYEGYYYNSTEPKYAATPNGSYACRMTARQANYWDTSPITDLGSHPGRSFPFTPLMAGS